MSNVHVGAIGWIIANLIGIQLGLSVVSGGQVGKASWCIEGVHDHGLRRVRVRSLLVPMEVVDHGVAKALLQWKNKMHQFSENIMGEQNNGTIGSIAIVAMLQWITGCQH